MKLFGLLIWIFFPITVYFAETLKVGSDLRSENLIQFFDQHGNLQTIPSETKYLIFASDMDASKIIHPYLLELKQEGMNSKKLTFLADIYKMPKIITKMIALPKMREYPYRIHLIQDEVRGNFFPKEKGKLIILNLENYKIQKISKASSKEELEKLLE